MASNQVVVRLDSSEIQTAVEKNYRLESSKYLDAATRLVVESPKDIEEAATYRANAKTLIKAAKEFFAPSLKKIDEAKKTLRASMNEIVEPLETAVRVIDAKIIAATKKLEAEAEKAAEAEADDEFGVTAAPSAKPKLATGLSRRTYYRAEVYDFEKFVAWCVRSENLHLLTPNAKALGDLARSTKGSLKIDGVKVVKEDGLAGGAN